MFYINDSIKCVDWRENVMENRLKRLREQQSLSVKFITRILNISPEEYYGYEAATDIGPDLLEKLTRLFGVERTDILNSNSNECSLNMNSLGFARTDFDITPKDKKEIEKLIKLQNKFNDM